MLKIITSIKKAITTFLGMNAYSSFERKAIHKEWLFPVIKT